VLPDILLLKLSEARNTLTRPGPRYWTKWIVYESFTFPQSPTCHNAYEYGYMVMLTILLTLVIMILRMITITIVVQVRMLVTTQGLLFGPLGAQQPRCCVCIQFMRLCYLFED